LLTLLVRSFHKTIITLLLLSHMRLDRIRGNAHIRRLAFAVLDCSKHFRGRFEKAASPYHHRRHEQGDCRTHARLGSVTPAGNPKGRSRMSLKPRYSVESCESAHRQAEYKDHRKIPRIVKRRREPQAPGDQVSKPEPDSREDCVYCREHRRIVVANMRRSKKNGGDA